MLNNIYGMEHKLKFGRHEYEVIITDQSEQNVSTGIVQIQNWTQRERSMRALKFGAMTFGFAVVSILIPLLHFFLVPSFLLATPIVAYLTYGVESTVLGGTGICPLCQKSFIIAKTTPKFPLNDICDVCKNSVKIKLKNENLEL